MENLQKANKIIALNKNPELVIYNELDILNNAIQTLIQATKETKTEQVSVTNLEDAKTDLTPLEDNFKALQESIDGVKQAIENIPEDKEIDLTKMEKLLKTISEHKMDMSGMTTCMDDISLILSDIKDKMDEDIQITLKIV